MKSIELAHRKYGEQTVYQRLTTSSSTADPYNAHNIEYQETFIPCINPISDELDNRMKMMEGGKERWQTLYELGQKRKDEMENLRQTYKDMKEDEERQMTFRPQLQAKFTEVQS